MGSIDVLVTKPLPEIIGFCDKHTNRSR